MSKETGTYQAAMSCRNCCHVWEPDIPQGTSVKDFHAHVKCPNCLLPACNPPAPPDLLEACRIAYEAFNEYGERFGFTPGMQAACWNGVHVLKAVLAIDRGSVVVAIDEY